MSLIPSRRALIDAISAYHSTYPEEVSFRTEFLGLLTHPRAFFRDHLPGHITGSCWILDRTHRCVLLTHHAKLNRWLQPGGHADGDEDILAVAMKEAQEETGLTSLEFASKKIFDLDIHPIPARKDFPEHRHFDVRVLMYADLGEPFHVSEESHGLAWVEIGRVHAVTKANASINRMVEKTRLL